MNEMNDVRVIPHIPVTFIQRGGKPAKWPTWVIGELPRSGDIVFSEDGIRGTVEDRAFYPNGRIVIFVL